MKKVICIANQKGGVGKTTTTVNLGACLALADQNILVLDLDPQGNATTGLGIAKSSNDDANIYTALIEGEIAPSMIKQTTVDKLKIIPSTTDLYGAELELVNYDRREERILQLIDQISDDFDFVLIDCPPSLGLLTLNALTAADSVLIPIQTEYYALEGLTQLDQTIAGVRSAFNQNLEIEGIIFTMVDARTTLAGQVMEEVKNYFGEKVFKTTIPRNVRLSEAPSHGQPIILYDIRSKGADAYVDLANELIDRNKEALTGPKEGSSSHSEEEIAPQEDNAIQSIENIDIIETPGDDVTPVQAEVSE